MRKTELIVFCETQIREHGRMVRYFLDLLHAARLVQEESLVDADEEDDDGTSDGR
jgi:hypothetical protein